MLFQKLRAFFHSTASMTGFTLVEVMVSMGLVVISFSLVTLSLTNMIPRASVKSAAELFISDLRFQQLQAISGKSASGSSETFGIYVEPQQYTLFSGASLAANPSSNFVVSLAEPLRINMSTSSAYVIFDHSSGELIEPAAPLTITVYDQLTEQKSITINALGVITALQ